MFLARQQAKLKEGKKEKLSGNHQYFNCVETQVPNHDYWTCSYLALLMFLARQPAKAAPRS